MTKNPLGKVQAALAALISQAEVEDLAGKIQVVVSASAGSDGLGEVAKWVHELEGELVRERDTAVECRLPMSRVQQLAESPAVSYVRLARLHSVT